jgi:hypothetical protein
MKRSQRLVRRMRTWCGGGATGEGGTVSGIAGKVSENFPNASGEERLSVAERVGERCAGGRDGVEREVGAGGECGDGTGEDVDGFAEGEGAGGDGAGAFAGERRVVEAALAGDDEIGGGEFVFEIEPRGDEIEAGKELGAGGGHEAERDAAGRAGAGSIHERIGALRVGAEQEREAGALVIEAREVGGAKAFLRAVGGGGAAGAEEGIGDVAGDADRAEGRARRGGGRRGARCADQWAGMGGRDGFAESRGVKREAEGGEGAEAEVAAWRCRRRRGEWRRRRGGRRRGG